MSVAPRRGTWPAGAIFALPTTVFLKPRRTWGKVYILMDCVGAPRVWQSLRVRFQVDAALVYRPLAIAIVSTLIDQIETADRSFRNDMITAFGEAFNNIVIHGYRDRSDGRVQVEAELRRDEMTLRLMDDGLTIDFSHTSVPDLDDLPEGGMGMFMINALVDHVAYSGEGPLNVMTLVKSTGCQGPPPSQLSNRTESR